IPISESNHPTIAEPATIQAVFTFQRMTMIDARMRIAHEAAPPRAATPSLIVTARIRPSDAALTPLRNALAAADFRSRGMNGLLISTKMNDGRKMQTVATAAPG